MKRTACLVTNIPAPYRVPVFDRAYEGLRDQGFDFVVIYLSASEPNRFWAAGEIIHPHIILSETPITFVNQYVRRNISSLIKALNKLKPAVVVTSGFNLSMLTAFTWARIRKIPHISFSDGTLESEKGIGFVRRQVRKVMLGRSRSAIGASLKTLELFQLYGVPSENLFQSCLCVDNTLFGGNSRAKEFDLLYVSQFIHRKMPDLVVEIMEQLGPTYSLLVVGNGELKNWLIDELQKNSVNFNYAGFIQSNEIPAIFQKGRILLFPTRSEAWGVVSNEACAAGIPVITTNEAGAAGELIVHGENGFVLPPDAGVWAEHIRKLLKDKELYIAMCSKAVSMVEPYSFENAARGIADAIMHSLEGKQ